MNKQPAMRSGLYSKVKVNISEGQKKKLQQALKDERKTVTIRFSPEDLIGEHVIALTKKQIQEMLDGLQNKSPVTLVLTRPQLLYNTKIDGGFIGALLPLLATAGKFLLSTALPALATGALAGVGTAAGSKAVDKIMGRSYDEAFGREDFSTSGRNDDESSDEDVFYIKRKGIPAKVMKMGNGLLMKPWSRGSSSLGDGLYLKRGSAISEGSGLILGPNSPFSSIPILGMLL